MTVSRATPPGGTLFFQGSIKNAGSSEWQLPAKYLLQLETEQRRRLCPDGRCRDLPSGRADQRANAEAWIAQVNIGKEAEQRLRIIQDDSEDAAAICHIAIAILSWHIQSVHDGKQPAPAWDNLILHTPMKLDRQFRRSSNRSNSDS